MEHMRLRLFFAALLMASSSKIIPAQAPSLTTLSAIHSLSNDQASVHLPVQFEATVTYFRSYERTMFVQDGDVAIYVQTNTPQKIVPGDRLLIRGTTHESFRPFVAATDIKIIGHGPLPHSVPASFKDLSHSRYDCRLVTVHAWVRAADVLNISVRNATLQMATDGGEIDATVDSDDSVALKDLLDAEVELTGPVSGRFDGKMQQTGILLHVSSLNDIKILKRAASSPWSLPITSMDQILLDYDKVNRSPRVRVQGTITYYQPGSGVVLQSGSKSLWIATGARSELAIGHIADATGIPDVHDGFLTLTRAEIQDSGMVAPVSPYPTTWTDLSQSRHLFDLVSTQGKLVMQVREAAQDEYVLLSEGHMFSAVVRHPAATYSSIAPPPLPPMKEIPLGSIVQVAGVCVLDDSNPFDANVPFNLLMRSADDLQVVARPSWVSVANLIKVVTILLLAFVLVSGWGWMLNRKVQRQTDDIAQRIAAEAAAERHNAQIEQRRSRILEDINGSRPLAEVLEEITELVSFHLRGAPCWCEINDGARLGHYPGHFDGGSVVREEIPGRSGHPLGTLFASARPDFEQLHEIRSALFMGARLSTVAIETRRLYNDLVHRSEFDLLTDIHNRFSLDKELERLISVARESAGIFGLIYIDLDEFKQVNDLYGHRIGDLYLQEVSVRMKRQLRSGDLLARLGGDEFAALVPTARTRADVQEIAARLENCFTTSFHVEGYVIRGSASVGISLYPEDGTSKDSLLSAADAAMYVTKHTRHEALDELEPGASPRRASRDS
ncbi:GGDEF domain-containing protein [Acidobacteria bacterium AB60]|nr:GGDEF domain-containing protein [Acidobacteria bacterium AB60]